MRLKGLLWGVGLSGLMWAALWWALAGCAPTGPVRYEDDPGHYPYYRPLRNEGEVGFYPRTDPGVVVGGSRNGSVVHNGRVYNEDGSMDYLRR